MKNKNYSKVKLVFKPKRRVNKFGIICYFNSKGQLHREDGPAYIDANGHQCWYRNGKAGRGFEISNINPDGSMLCYVEGMIIHGIDRFGRRYQWK